VPYDSHHLHPKGGEYGSGEDLSDQQDGYVSWGGKKNSHRKKNVICPKKAKSPPPLGVQSPQLGDLEGAGIFRVLWGGVIYGKMVTPKKKRLSLLHPPGVGIFAIGRK